MKANVLTYAVWALVILCAGAVVADLVSTQLNSLAEVIANVK